MSDVLMFDGNFQTLRHRRVQFHKKVESKDSHNECERSSFISNARDLRLCSGLSVNLLCSCLPFLRLHKQTGKDRQDESVSGPRGQRHCLGQKTNCCVDKRRSEVIAWRKDPNVSQ